MKFYLGKVVQIHIYPKGPPIRLLLMFQAALSKTHTLNFSKKSAIKWYLIIGTSTYKYSLPAKIIFD